MMRKIIPILVIVLIGCTPQKKLNRLIKKYPQLVHSDTIYLPDTTFISSTEFDTTFIDTSTHDTTYITKDRVKIKYLRNGEKIYLYIKTPPDTIIKNVPAIINTVQPKKTEAPKWLTSIKSILIWIAIMAIIYAGYRVKKWLKKKESTK